MMGIVPDFCIYFLTNQNMIPQKVESYLLKNMRLCVSSEKQGQITKIFSDNCKIFY